MRIALLIFVLTFCFEGIAQDKKNRRIPQGIKPSKTQETKIKNDLQFIRSETEKLRSGSIIISANWINDIEVIAEGTERVLSNQEFKDAKQIETAFKLINIAKNRLSHLSDSITPWKWPASGFALRGYQSKIDESFQPYGLEIPPSVIAKLKNDQLAEGVKLPLEVWLHGRDDGLHEIKFMNQRLSKSSPFPFNNAIVLHPYGRYCNAFKFAGEVDVMEAIQEVMEDYPIDPDKIILRGFSMGGGGVWHLATHFPDIFAFASPGAGFSETFDYLGLKNKPERPDYERTLWNWYDATAYAGNLANLPITAYSGEIDKQIQAARMMESAMEKEGMRLDHVIGKGMGHKYNAESIDSINRKTQATLKLSPIELPRNIEFSTATLRYPKTHWFKALGLSKHWRKSKASGETLPLDSQIQIQLENITSFELTFETGQWSGPINKPVRVIINKQELNTFPPKSDRSWRASFSKTNQSSEWSLIDSESSSSDKLTKSPGIQGPIDDAFLSRFIAVSPEGKGLNQNHDAFSKNELDTLREEWNHQFRGKILEKKASHITETDIANSNLILFGDPKNNEIIAKILPNLPIKWTSKSIRFGGREFPADSSSIKLVFPNPLNSTRYVVLNSGFTFHSTISSSNADQTPKLPDYAIMDISNPLSSSVINAGFFDENWNE